MAVLEIRWETMAKIPALTAPVVTGEGDEVTAPAGNPNAARKLAADKPYWILAQESGTELPLEVKNILGDDRVALGSHAFHAVKMSTEEVKADPALGDKAGKESVRFIYLSADHKTVTVVEGKRIGVGAVWDAMKSTANRFYKQNLDSTVRELRDVLVEYDKVNMERGVLEDKVKRLGGTTMSAGDKKDVEAKREELAKREKKAQDREKALWEMKPKAA